MKQIIHIDGWWGVGKSTLCRLLDGHAEVISFPVQDNLIGALAVDPDRDKTLAYRDSVRLRKLLASSSGYYRWERDALAGGVPLALDKHTVLSWPFDFSFFDFDRDCRLAIEQAHAWTAERIVNLIYDRIPAYWRPFSGPDPASLRCVCMGDNVPKAIHYLVDNVPNAKAIYIVRSPEGILATRGSRAPLRERDVGSNEAQDFMTVDYLIETGEVERILAAESYVCDISVRHPSRVLLLDFNAMVERHVDTMHQVAEFLEMPYEPILERFTFLGEEVVPEDGKRFVGKANDDPREILTRTQWEEIERRKASFRRDTQPGTIRRPMIAALRFGQRVLRGLEWRLRR